LPTSAREYGGRPCHSRSASPRASKTPWHAPHLLLEPGQEGLVLLTGVCDHGPAFTRIEESLSAVAGSAWKKDQEAAHDSVITRASTSEIEVTPNREAAPADAKSYGWE
jgi:hypothetical protein